MGIILRNGYRQLLLGEAVTSVCEVSWTLVVSSFIKKRFWRSFKAPKIFSSFFNPQALAMMKSNAPCQIQGRTLKKINRLHDVVVKNKPLSKSEKDELEAKKKKKDEKILMAKKQPEMKQPTYRLKIGTERLLMMVQCDLPKGLKGVDLDLSEDNLILAMPGHLNLNVDLPKAVDPERAQAKFSKKSKELRISMPLVLEDEK
eukprot:jgi/Bigna1/79754/fgenesh1_pg.65_\